MKKYLEITLFFSLILFSPVLLAQDKELVMEDVAQDDLGNVTDEFQEYFFEALREKAIENHEKAIQALQKCLEIDPKPVVYFELGKNYNALQRYSEASVSLEKADRLDPKNEAILEELYKTYYESQEFQKAQPVVEELQSLDGTYAEDLANIYILNEEFNKALELLDQLDEERGESEYREGLRRQIYAKTDNVDARINDIQKKILENPEEEDNYLNLIFVYSESGNKEAAFEAAKKLLEKNPESEKVHLALYKFYLNDKNTEEALVSMKTILNGDQIDEETKYEVLNDFLNFVGENPSLEEDLMEMVKVFSEDEGNTKVFAQLGTYFLESGRKEKALEYFETGLENGEIEFDIIVKTLLLQLEAGKSVQAKELSEKTIADYPSQPILYLMNGTALNQLEEYSKAEEILSFGLDFLIDNPKMEANFYQQLAISYKGLNELEKASEFEMKAKKLKTTEGNE